MVNRSNNFLVVNIGLKTGKLKTDLFVKATGSDHCLELAFLKHIIGKKFYLTVRHCFMIYLQQKGI